MALTLLLRLYFIYIYTAIYLFLHVTSPAGFEASRVRMQACSHTFGPQSVLFALADSERGALYCPPEVFSWMLKPIAMTSLKIIKVLFATVISVTRVTLACKAVA